MSDLRGKNELSGGAYPSTGSEGRILPAAQAHHPVPHKPVMLTQMVNAMQPADGETYVDGTFGAGGYSRALLESAECRVYAIDRDPNVARLADLLKQDFPDRFFLLAGTFGNMVELLAAQGVTSVNGVVLDIGVSSMQIDVPGRGFSFSHDGPLDMRMGALGLSAADIVNRYSEKEIADILYMYGEEKASRRIARAIVKAREETPITRTKQLADIVRGVIPPSPRLRRDKGKIDPATRTFQGLRIAVNEELGELEQGLEAAEQLLAPGGRLLVVTFHSLEDRIVKQFYQSRSGDTRGGSRHLPATANTAPSTFFLPGKKPVLPDEAEIAANPRARSAKLRIAVRTGQAVKDRR
jgi:16S rRNA (cytosine1402-N4)-methyltransferase